MNAPDPYRWPHMEQAICWVVSLFAEHPIMWVCVIVVVGWSYTLHGFYKTLYSGPIQPYGPYERED